MDIKLIGGLDYNKVRDAVGNVITDENKIDEILSSIEDIEKARHAEIVSTAGRLSRFPGNVLEVLEKSEGKDITSNSNFANKVISMGHKSITDHDYLVFALKDVSVIIEHLLISERFASFTIKSRREVDFSNAGYYVPEFRNKFLKSHGLNGTLESMYSNYIDDMFKKYSYLVDKGISKEDARFILPYCYYSNIMMGIDAHTLLDMIIKFTKTKYAKIAEVKELGDKLYEIAKEYTPYLIPYIDAVPVNYKDSISDYLDSKIENDGYEILDSVKLLNRTNDIDDTILISAIMRRYQYSYDKAKSVYDELCRDENFKKEFMKKITFEGDRSELSQVNFDFQIPVSYAILTHLQRHRTHKFMMPEFTDTDLLQYKVPPSIKKDKELYKLYKKTYSDNKKMYDKFLNNGVNKNDLIYFNLSGNMVNILTNMDGWTLRHILELRECSKAQWETRKIAYDMHKEIDKLPDAEAFSSVLGPTCDTQGICNEGKESCGKVKRLEKHQKNR